MNKLVMGLLATFINKKYREQIKACRERSIPLVKWKCLLGGYHKSTKKTPVVFLPDVQEHQV